MNTITTPVCASASANARENACTLLDSRAGALENNNTPRTHLHSIEIVAFPPTDGFVYAINAGPNKASNTTHLHALTMLLSEVLCGDGSGLVVVHVMPDDKIELSVSPSYDDMARTTALTNKIKEDGLRFIIQTLVAQYTASVVKEGIQNIAPDHDACDHDDEQQVNNSDDQRVVANLVTIGYDTPRAIDTGDVTVVLQLNKTVWNSQMNTFFNSSPMCVS